MMDYQRVILKCINGELTYSVCPNRMSKIYYNNHFTLKMCNGEVIFFDD